MKRGLAKLFLWAALCCVGSPSDGADLKGGCPIRQGQHLIQIDIFDGNPADLAYLAPDDDERGINTYTLKKIYRSGGFATVRCKYSEGGVLDIKLVKAVWRCKFAHTTSRGQNLLCK